MAEKLRRRTFQKGEVIFHEDDPGDRLYFLGEGMVKISLVSSDGRENDIVLLTPGDCFGEMSVLDGGTSRLRIKGVSDRPYRTGP